MEKDEERQERGDKSKDKMKNFLLKTRKWSSVCLEEFDGVQKMKKNFSGIPFKSGSVSEKQKICASSDQVYFDKYCCILDLRTQQNVLLIGI
ncbi:uncharacterized protein LOC111717223 isoform X2 [Eurytemora carolleeae]|nr:uncharacterized protein LOC111717223 isoform X2 [Eurytemora carolleeae]|eukprot:XP_023348505.1 uncharacterized protein LOC111717223 isoform X2 [Eurytemora affinis]